MKINIAFAIMRKAKKSEEDQSDELDNDRGSSKIISFVLDKLQAFHKPFETVDTQDFFHLLYYTLFSLINKKFSYLVELAFDKIDQIFAVN